MNDKQILTECFKLLLTIQGLVVTKTHTYLNKHQVKDAGLFKYVDHLLPPGLKGLRRFTTCYKFLDNFIEIWSKFWFQGKQGSPIPWCTSKEAALMRYKLLHFFKKNLMVHFRLYIKYIISCMTNLCNCL